MEGRQSGGALGLIHRFIGGGHWGGEWMESV